MSALQSKCCLRRRWQTARRHRPHNGPAYGRINWVIASTVVLVPMVVAFPIATSLLPGMLTLPGTLVVVAMAVRPCMAMSQSMLLARLAIALIILLVGGGADPVTIGYVCGMIQEGLADFVEEPLSRLREQIC